MNLSDILKKCDEDNGWASANGKCYKMYMNTDREWEGAKAYCRSVDGDLVDVNSADEQNIVTAASQLSGVSFWIGLTNKVRVPVIINFKSYNQSATVCVPLWLPM